VMMLSDHFRGMAAWKNFMETQQSGRWAKNGAPKKFRCGIGQKDGWCYRTRSDGWEREELHDESQCHNKW